VITRLAVPTIRRLLPDEALQDAWLSGPGGGLTELQRIRSLRRLLRELGPAARLADVDEAAERAVREQLARDQVELPGVLVRHGLRVGRSVPMHANDAPR